MIKPSVLAVVPRKGWAFERKAQQIQKYSEKIDLKIMEFSEVYRNRNIECDILLPFWWKWLAVGQLDGIKVNFGTVGALYDAWSWTGTRPGGLLEKALTHCDCLVVANEQFIACLRQRFNRLPPIIVGTDAVDLNEFNPPEVIPPLDQFTAMWVGNSRASSQISDDADLKGLDLITNACADSNVYLVKADLHNTYIPLHEMAQFYLKGHVLMVGSYSEGGPCPLLEAAAMGKGIITTRVGIAQRIVAHGINGVIVDRSPAGMLNGLAFMRQQYEAGMDADIARISRASAQAFSAEHVVKSAWDTAFDIVMKWGRPRRG